MNRKEKLEDDLEQLAADIAVDWIEEGLADKHRKDKATDEDVDFIFDLMEAMEKNDARAAAKAYKSIVGVATRKKVAKIFFDLGFPVPGAVYENPMPTVTSNDLMLLGGGVLAGALVGWWYSKRPAAIAPAGCGGPPRQFDPGIVDMVRRAMTGEARLPAPAGSAQCWDRTVAMVNQLPLEAVHPAGQAMPTADPAFWGAWFRGHIGTEALQRAQALINAYGHHRAAMMIVDAVGTDLYGQGAKW